MTILRRPISTSAADLLSATDNFSLDKRKTEKSNGMRNDLKLFSYFSPQQVGFNTTFYLLPAVLVSVNHYYNRQANHLGVPPENNITTAWVEVRNSPPFTITCV